MQKKTGLLHTQLDTEVNSINLLLEYCGSGREIANTMVLKVYISGMSGNKEVSSGGGGNDGCRVVGYYSTTEKRKNDEKTLL